MKQQPVVIEANTVTDIIVESGKAYENPFMDVTLDAVVTAQSGLRAPVDQPDVVQPGVQLMRSGEDVGPSVPSLLEWVK